MWEARSPIYFVVRMHPDYQGLLRVACFPDVVTGRLQGLRAML